MAATVSASVARPVRGAGQNGVAYGIVSWWAAAHALTPEQFGLAVLILGAVVTYLHNLAEDRGWIPAILKAEPTADPVPVVDTTVSSEPAKATRPRKVKRDAGHADLIAVLVVVLVVVVLLLATGVIR